MQGKICLVTGATSGIGKETAKGLAQMGTRVVIVGRDREKSERTVEEIGRLTGSQAVDFLLADFESQAAVRGLAQEFQIRYPRLDVLVNNAGATFIRRGETEVGLERTFAVNHLSYFLLTNLLLESLKAAAPSRIVNVASNAHAGRRLDFDDLQNKKGYRGLDVYGQSKLANLYFTYELACRLEGSGVTANALHPGFVATNMGANNVPFFGSLVKGIINLAAISVEEGARTVLYLAASPEVEGVSGGYFYQEKAIHSSPVSYDEEAARRLWAASAELTGLADK